MFKNVRCLTTQHFTGRHFNREDFTRENLAPKGLNREDFFFDNFTREDFIHDTVIREDLWTSKFGNELISAWWSTMPSFMLGTDTGPLWIPPIFLLDISTLSKIAMFRPCTDGVPGLDISSIRELTKRVSTPSKSRDLV